MSSRFKSTVVEDARVVTVRLVGVLDQAAAAQVRTVAHKVLADHPTALIFDLSALSLGDEAFLAIFRAVARFAADEYDAAVLLCSIPVEVTVALQALALHPSLAICKTRAEADRQARRKDHGRRVSRHLQPVPEAAAEARVLTTDACTRWGVSSSVAERLLVIVTELVGNAVRHAGTPIEFTLRCSNHYVHVHVRDLSNRPGAIRGPTFPDAESGRGLMLVDAFTSAWGCRPTPDGKVMWATIRRQPLVRSVG